MRPYGEWLAAETVTLQALMDSIPPERRMPPPVMPVAASTSHTNGATSSGNGNGATAAPVRPLA